MLEALSREIRSGCPEELLYADDLASVSEMHKCLKWRLESWKRALESMGFQVNIKKTKIMISSENAGKVTVEGKFPYAFSRKDVGSNTVLSNSITYLLTASFAGVGFIRDVVVLEVS